MPRLAYVAAVCLLAAACGERPPQVSLEDVEPPAKAGAPRRLRIAISPMQSPQLSFAHYSGIFALIGRRLDEPVDLIQRQTYSEVVSLVEHRRVEAALVCSGPFLRARDDFGARILVVPQISGSTSYRALVIVHRDSGYRSFDDLRGKTFALTDPLSTSGMMYPAWLARQRGTITERFFGKLIFTKSHDNSVASVAERLVDGASVSGLVFADFKREHPDLARRLRVVAESPPFGNPPLIIHPSTDPGLTRRLREALLSLHEDAEGRKVLDAAGIERFVLGDPEAYLEAQRMRAAVLGRMGS